MSPKNAFQVWCLMMGGLSGCEVVFPLEGPPTTCQPSDDPVGYWRLDETTGPIAKDSSGNGIDGVYRGAVGFGVAGVFPGETAVSVGTDLGGVDLGNHFDFAGTAAFSVEAWVQPRVLDSGAFRHIVTKQHRTSPKAGWALLIDPGGNAFFERFVNDAVHEDSPHAQVAVSEYTQLVGTYDGQQLRLFANSLDLGVVPFTGAMPPVTEPAVIGGASIADADAPLDGDIDEVTIYDFALTNDQVRAHFVAQRPFCPSGR